MQFSCHFESASPSLRTSIPDQDRLPSQIEDLSTLRRAMETRSRKSQGGTAPSLKERPNNAAPTSTSQAQGWSLMEVALFSLYPIILFLGSLSYVLSSGISKATISTWESTRLDQDAPSYFARKSNIFNVYFVKIGWAWMVLAFTLFTLRCRTSNTRQDSMIAARRIQAFARLGVLTLWWIVVAQWFFGPALMERSFRITGGTCELLLSDSTARRADSIPEPLTEIACKMAGGKWRGGHDISGHVFLLVLSSAALVIEAVPFLRAKNQAPQQNRRSDAAELRDNGGEYVYEKSPEILLTTFVVIMDLWMLLMTATYFHTFQEKVRLERLGPDLVAMR